MSGTFDPRVTPARPDLAARALKGRVQAERYADGTAYRVGMVAPLFAGPDTHQPRLSEALYGEIMTVYECGSDWAWGQLHQDGYVGWIERMALNAELGPEPDYRVNVPLMHVYADRHVRAAVQNALPMGSRLAVQAREEKWCRLHGRTSGWVYAAQIGPIDGFAKDFVAVAESLIGAPYVWGGRQVTGLDCSALVQIALAQAGIASPRDSDMQEKQLGQALASWSESELSGLARGDLVFWPGHVGIMIDETSLLHANATSMMTEIEPLMRVADRILQMEGHAIRSVRRIADYSGQGARI